MKATLKIIQRLSYESKDGTFHVCLRYISYRRVVYIALNISIHPKHWSDNKKMVLASHVCLQAKVHQSHLSVLYFKPS